ncbi:CRIM1 protein, partial [Polypterus senegalus]
MLKAKLFRIISESDSDFSDSNFDASDLEIQVENPADELRLESSKSQHGQQNRCQQQTTRHQPIDGAVVFTLQVLILSAVLLPHGVLGFLFPYSDYTICKLNCSDVKCPDQLKADCPADSILRQDLVSENSCCPIASQRCVCDQEACVKKTCPEGFLLILVSQGKGTPGECCDVYECQRVSTKCFHDGKVYGDREVYRMDTCWLCQCRQGISFCSKVECAELECDSFYIPDGECCAVCKDMELLHLGSGGASCWAGNTLRQHEEQWKEDDCTFCQCVNGDPHCTAMSCKQSCQNPVKIPGECCPFCEDDSCPDLTTYCSLQCPTGYEVDDYGCQVCECVSQIPKCRPISCGKTCPHGYVKNKHGCEMCRCVKCPPFICGKECPEGYKQNRKGCFVCACKETDEVLTTTPPLAPKISYCLTTSGHRYKEGESWHDGCRDCYCHAGHEMCVLITCLVPNCSHPVVRDEQCCPSCEDGTTTVIPVILSTRSSTLETSYVDEQTQRLPTTEPHTTVSSTALARQNLLDPETGECREDYGACSVLCVPDKMDTVWSLRCHTVILKKHVTKNSVVYMEPSSEDAFQSIRNGCTLGLAKDLSSPGRDRYGSKQNSPLD